MLRVASKKMKTDAVKTKNFTKLRDWFMTELALNAGLRVAEITTLRPAHLLIENGRSSILVTGKGNKTRVVWISEYFKRVCVEFQRLKNTLGFDISADSYLLCNAKGKQIATRSLQRAFKRILLVAQLPSHFHPHCLRHTYATHLLQASNLDFRFVQKQLGHSSIRVTEVYLGVFEPEGRRALERIYA